MDPRSQRIFESGANPFSKTYYKSVDWNYLAKEIIQRNKPHARDLNHFEPSGFINYIHDTNPQLILPGSIREEHAIQIN